MIDDLHTLRENLNVKKQPEGPREAPLCSNCRKAYRHHLDQKCPFEASTYDTGPEPYLYELFVTWEEPGGAVGNVAAIPKIKLW